MCEYNRPKIFGVEFRGSTAGYIPLAAKGRDSTETASRYENIVAGAGSVRSSAGTYTACIDVIDPETEAKILSWKVPISVDSVG